MSIKITTFQPTHDEALSDALAKARKYYGNVWMLLEERPAPDVLDRSLLDGAWIGFWEARLCQRTDAALFANSIDIYVFAPVVHEDQPKDIAPPFVEDEESDLNAIYKQFAESLQAGEYLRDLATDAWTEIKSVYVRPAYDGISPARVEVTFVRVDGVLAEGADGTTATSAWFHPHTEVEYLPKGFFEPTAG